MWTYRQIDGALLDQNEKILSFGYSGAGAGKNNPEMENVHDVGPIPRGRYRIGKPVDTVTHGPRVLPLTPFPENKMFGRSGFLMHGDSVVNPGTASEGCIVQPRFARERVAESGDDVLVVVRDEGDNFEDAEDAAVGEK